MSIGLRTKVWRWLPLGVCLLACAWLFLVEYLGWFAKRDHLTTPYLDGCSAIAVGYRCASDAPSMKVVSFQIKLKARRDYRITIVGRSLTTNPVSLSVDFAAPPDYDSPDQRSRIRLTAGAAASHVMQWSSGMPPEKAWLRIANADATSYEITSVTVQRPWKWLPALLNTALLLTSALLLREAWRERRRLQTLHLRQRTRNWIARGDLGTPAMLAAGVAVVLLIRVSTLGAPMVFGDEMSYALLASSLGDPTAYSHNSLLLPLPNQLYFDVFYLATLCGDAMLSCARALNCLLYALAAFPLFALARRFLPKREAVLMTAVILLLPTNSYTGFFMPESFYFLVFYFVAWTFVAFLDANGGNRHAAAAGFCLAALSLVKPHGLVILLACNLTLLAALCLWREERHRIAMGWGSLMAVFLLSRGVLGISAAPGSDASWLDRMLGLYAKMIANTLQFSSDPKALAHLWLATTNNLGTLLLLFGPALLAIGCRLSRRRAEIEQSDDVALDRLSLFTLLTLTCLLMGTIKFTAYVAGVENPESIHERYYDFSFGLLLLCGWCSARALSRQPRHARTRALMLLLPIGGCACWYFSQCFGDMSARWVIHPVLFAMWTVQSWGIAFLALAILLSLLLFPLRMVLASRIYAVCMLVICIVGFAAIWNEQAYSQTSQPADRALHVLQSLYTPAQLQHGVVIGESLFSLYRTTFYLRNDATVGTLPAGSTIDTAKIAADAEWLLTFGHYQVTDAWESKLELPDHATLYRHLERSQNRNRAQEPADRERNAPRH